MCEKLNLVVDRFINGNEILIKQVYDIGLEYSKKAKQHREMYSQDIHSTLKNLNQLFSNKTTEFSIYQKTNNKVLKKPFYYYKCQQDKNDIVTRIRTFSEKCSPRDARILLKYADLITDVSKIENERKTFMDKNRKFFDNFKKSFEEINKLSKRKSDLFEQLVKLLLIYSLNNNDFDIQPQTEKEIAINSYDDFLDYIHYLLLWGLNKAKKYIYSKLLISKFEEKLELLSKEEKNKKHELFVAKMKLSKLKTHLTNKFEKVRNDYTNFADFLKKSVNENYKSLTDIVSDMEDELKNFVSDAKTKRIRYKAEIKHLNEKLKTLNNSPPPSFNFS